MPKDHLSGRTGLSLLAWQVHMLHQCFPERVWEHLSAEPEAWFGDMAEARGTVKGKKSVLVTGIFSKSNQHFQK